MEPYLEKAKSGMESKSVSSQHSSQGSQSRYAERMAPEASTAEWPVAQVSMDPGVYRSCLNQALSTEVEEVMGLLVGWHDPVSRFTHITHAIQLQRNDKRKDRVEIPPEQLAQGTERAEQMSLERRAEMKSQPQTHQEILMGRGSGPLGQSARRMRDADVAVLGWYHSHPHITVNPSAVDIRTQHQFQSHLNAGFIGLIFSVYNTNGKGLGVLPYIAFQTYEAPLRTTEDDLVIGGQVEARYLPLHIVPKLFPAEETTKELLSLDRATLTHMAELPQHMGMESESAWAEAAEKAQDEPLQFLHNLAHHLKAKTSFEHSHLRPLYAQLQTRRQRLMK